MADWPEVGVARVRRDELFGTLSPVAGKATRYAKKRHPPTSEAVPGSSASRATPASFGRWSIFALAPARGYAGALVVEGPPPDPRGKASGTTKTRSPGPGPPALWQPGMWLASLLVPRFASIHPIVSSPLAVQPDAPPGRAFRP